jgi:hypothetical protein
LRNPPLTRWRITAKTPNPPYELKLLSFRSLGLFGQNAALARQVANKGSSHLPNRADIETALRRLAPRMPAHEFGAVVDHALDSAGLRTSAPESAAWLSLVAYVRHALTDYDNLLDEGYDRDSARFFVADDIRGILAGWGVRRPLTAED